MCSVCGHREHRNDSLRPLRRRRLVVRPQQGKALVHVWGINHARQVPSQYFTFPITKFYQDFGIFASFAELVDKVAGAMTTWCNTGSEIRKRLRPRRRIQSSESCGRPEESRRRGDKSSVCTSCSPRSSLLRVSCSVTGQNR